MEIRTVKYHQKNIGYRVSGTGHPVMLIHGFGEDGSIWDRQVEALESNFRLYVPDLPGTGLSEEAIDAEQEWTMEKFAKLIREIAIQEHLNTFSLLGHSMGGYITLAFADAFPDMLNGFGLIHSSAFADSEEKLAARKKGLESIKTQGADKFLEQLIPGLYGDQYKSVHPEEITKHIESMKGIKDLSLSSYTTAMMLRPDRKQVLTKAQKPVLFIIGAEDKTVNLADSLEQAHIPEQSHVTLLEKSAHMGMREETRKTTSAIQEYLWRLNEN